MINKIINNYEITDFIDEGGMGTVYKGINIKLERPVAIKVLHSSLTNNPEFRLRFLNEAKILAKLSHPNIINIYDFIEFENKFYIVTEFLEGKTLEKIIESNEVRSLSDRVNFFRSVLEGMQYAHSNSIIHRDIKPSNIFILKNNSVKILDFGIAKLSQTGSNLTRTGTRMGSISYMSPEQVLGKEVNQSSDIYSLGITLYELISGNLPFDTNTESDYIVQNKIVNENIPDIKMFNPDLPQSIIDVINKATSKNPANRFRDCNEFLISLEDVSFSGEVVRTHSSTIPYDQDKTIIVEPSGQSNAVKTQFLSSESIPKGHSKGKSYILVGGIIIAALITISIIAYFLSRSNDQDSIVSLSENSKESIDLKKKKSELEERERKLNEDEKKLNMTNQNSGENTSSISSINGKYPQASIRYLDDNDLRFLTKTELQIMRNEIFARHGYIFKTNPEMVRYFSSQPWYIPLYSNVNGMLTEIEKRNLNLIKQYEFTY